MSFSPDMAAQRFGYGLSPLVTPPKDVEQMLSDLRGPDLIAERFPLGRFRDLQTRHALFEHFRRHERENLNAQAGKASREKRRALQREARQNHLAVFVRTQQRRIHASDGFRERLTVFWGDHFTAIGKRGLMKLGAPLYIEDAIRPHVTGRFVDMLLAAVKHPLMLHYLDQVFSAGPNSRVVKRRRPDGGLNENLAREVLELHTLGVGGPYSQDDVRSLAHLFTGLSRGRNYGYKFRFALAEPGPQTVLGRAYEGRLSPARIDAVLRDLAAHPVTAAHLARKLATHFISDIPPAEITSAMAQRYLETDGDLMAVYATMLSHPQAWEGPARNIRPPDEFVSASLRALGLAPEVMVRLNRQRVARLFIAPLRKMGQEWLTPNGPDGFSEEDAAWVTPQGVAGRMEWAMQVPRRLLNDLPDPRQFVRDALGDRAPQKVVFAASAAESRAEAVGLVLMSPAFQRR